VAASTFFVILVLGLCVAQVVRKRRRNKKQHINRLMNDLNATEKFAIADDDASDSESE
jgi:hypothetical protein